MCVPSSGRLRREQVARITHNVCVLVSHACRSASSSSTALSVVFMFRRLVLSLCGGGEVVVVDIFVSGKKRESAHPE